MISNTKIMLIEIELFNPKNWIKKKKKKEKRKGMP